ncbi:hypothetical protein MPSI1_001219 [Malassezia psittaci]|uniref:BZIP domain-containing protein n=1 Tax=Malassezia psittaci TaxID=1821823 RepID=A0AAF0F4J1_9BASI|nr:hypothetical protein MPSI1_001219 [Malassezia psittaci]
MASDDHNSISFILGLNQFQEGSTPTENVEESHDTQQQALLAGLNTLPSGRPEQSEADMTNFANQLSLWTNASFNFDGPMGHALIGDEEKESPKNHNYTHREDEDDRIQRFLAASSAHSNAARDKNRELDRESRMSSMNAPGSDSSQGVHQHNAFVGNVPNSVAPEPPLDMLSSAAPTSTFPHPSMRARNDTHRPTNNWGHASQPSANSNQPLTQLEQRSDPQPASGTNWDLTSTLALQYLLSRNPNVLQNLPLDQPPQAAVIPPNLDPSSWTSTTGAPSSASSSAQASSSSNGGASLPPPFPNHSLQQTPSQGVFDQVPSSTDNSGLSTQTAAPLLATQRSSRESIREPPTTDFTFVSQNQQTRESSLNRKRSSSSSRVSEAAHADREADLEDGNLNGDSGVGDDQRLNRGAASDRVKLVDTGNPEADAEANRLALEEDKRRRNTAASARFRVKKKQREAALEMTARELETQVSELKQSNERLRTENEWLKRLITARPEGLSAVLGAAMPPSYIANPANAPQLETPRGPMPQTSPVKNLRDTQPK